jgi:transposase
LIEDQKTTIQELRQLLSKPASTEKTDKVLENARPKPNNTADTKAPRKPRKGHGRSGAKAYSAASRIRVRHASLASGDCCPKCLKGTLYA